MRQDGAVDALRFQHIDVVLAGEFPVAERFARAKQHVPGVADEHIPPSLCSEERLDRGVDRLLSVTTRSTGWIDRPFSDA